MIPCRFISFLRRDDGAALVEFGLLFPIFGLVLGLAVEGARTFWSYQTAIAGVRDASRHLSRVVDADACATPANPTDISNWNSTLARIVRTDERGARVFAAGVTVTDVVSVLSCVDGGYRGGHAPVARVTATLRIDYPFSGLFRLSGVPLDHVSTTVSDSTRIIGS